VSAYEELVTLFRTSDKPNDFYPYESHLKKMATDVNAVAQEAGLNAVLHYVENAPSAAKYVKQPQIVSYAYHVEN
jgi:cytoskeleton-associated protein 5